MPEPKKICACWTSAALFKLVSTKRHLKYFLEKQIRQRRFLSQGASGEA